MKAIVDDILDKIPDQFNMVEIMQKVEEEGAPLHTLTQNTGASESGDDSNVGMDLDEF